MQLAAARAGLGVLLVPEPYLLPAGLVPVRYTPALATSAEEWPVDALWLVGHRALRDVPRVAVWDFVAREIRRAPAVKTAATGPGGGAGSGRARARKRSG